MEGSGGSIGLVYLVGDCSADITSSEDRLCSGW